MTKLSKEVQKEISKNEYYNEEQFLADAKDYIKAIKDGRMICNIDSVSNSGMSRVIRFLSCEKSKHGFYYRNYYAFFKALGFSEVKNGFRISGCGMDMIFHTNYTIIHRLHSMKFITKKTCDSLAQKTPTVI